MDQVECIVVGAGVVGLACAAAIARSGREVMVLEAEDGIGTHSSSRNSEVVHAGIYYEPGSLKAQLCVAGKEMLYRYAKDHGVNHQQIGKLIVATTQEQISRLRSIKENAAACGVTDLTWISREEASSIEPSVSCEAALHSPSTGIIDSHALMLALQGDLESHSGMVVLQTRVAGVSPVPEGGFIVGTAGPNATKLQSRYLVNAAGLFAPDVARSIVGLDPAYIPHAHFAIGHYYRLSGASPCKHLIYPVPEPGGLGIHLTLDLGRQARFGPDVRWIGGIDYSFDDNRTSEFHRAIANYLPDIGQESLVPDYTGIRPKIAGPGEPNADFRIDGHELHAIDGLVNLFGIESPGLTASLAIAEMVADRLS